MSYDVYQNGQSFILTNQQQQHHDQSESINLQTNQINYPTNAYQNNNNNNNNYLHSNENIYNQNIYNYSFNQYFFVCKGCVKGVYLNLFTYIISDIDRGRFGTIGFLSSIRSFSSRLFDFTAFCCVVKAGLLMLIILGSPSDFLCLVKVNSCLD